MSNEVDSSPPTVGDIEVTTYGEFPGAAEYARTKIGRLARLTRRPIHHARVRLTRRHNPAADHSVVAQVNMDVNGHVVRAQVDADTALEAIDKLESRLRRRMEHLPELREVRRGPGAAPPWRRDDEPVRQARAVARVADDSRIIRRKSYALTPCTVDEAVTEMELLDYDFHLFNEIGSGAAAVVYRGGPTRYRLDLVAPTLAAHVGPHKGLVTISPHPVPCLREEDAIERLALMDLPFLFYIDAAQGRASVLYRRYDGDFGVITPAG